MTAGSHARVAVVGLGLIGGSVALRLVAQGHDVAGVDPDAATRARVAPLGVSVHERAGGWLADRDLVVVAAPLAAVPAVLGEVARYNDHATVVDVGSVKQAVHAAASDHGLGRRFVGCHPMAGSHLSGIAAADADLVAEVTWAVTVDDDADRDRLDRVVGFLVDAFSAQVAIGRPRWHDRVVAAVSHLPHVLAARLLASLADLPHPEAGAALAAGSFRDGTRVAGTDTARTTGMVVHNRDAVREELVATIADLGALLERLDDDDKVAAWFETARRARTAYLSGEVELRSVGRGVTTAELVALGEQGWLVTAVDEAGYELARGALNRELRQRPSSPWT